MKKDQWLNDKVKFNTLITFPVQTSREMTLFKNIPQILTDSSAYYLYTILSLLVTISDGWLLRLEARTNSVNLQISIIELWMLLFFNLHVLVSVEKFPTVIYLKSVKLEGKSLVHPRKWIQTCPKYKGDQM